MLIKAFTLNWNQTQHCWKCVCVCVYVCIVFVPLLILQNWSVNNSFSLASPLLPPPPHNQNIIHIGKIWWLWMQTTRKQLQIHFSTHWFQKSLSSSHSKTVRFFFTHAVAGILFYSLSPRIPRSLSLPISNTILYFIHSSPPPTPSQIVVLRTLSINIRTNTVYLVAVKFFRLRCVFTLFLIPFAVCMSPFSLYLCLWMLVCHCIRDTISLIFHTSERLSMYYLFVYLAVGVFIKISTKCIYIWNTV